MRNWIVLGLLFFLITASSAIGQENQPFNSFGKPPSEREIRERVLSEKLETIAVDCQVFDSPLVGLIEQWGEKHEIDFSISAEANAQSPTPAEIRVTVLIRGVPLSQALTSVLSGHDLDWYIDEQRVIITTRKFAKSKLTLQSHDLKDLDAKHVIRRLGDRLGAELEATDGHHRGYQFLTEENVLRVRQTAELQRQIAAIVARMKREHDSSYESTSDPFGDDADGHDPFGDSSGADDPFGQPPRP